MVILTHGLLFALAVTVGPPYVVDYRLEPEVELLDRSVYRTPPGSLRLNVAGEGGYRCFAVPRVRPGHRYRLSFHYLVAAGSDGIFVVRVCDFEGTRLEWSLVTVGRWVRVDVDFNLGHKVTSAAVVFEAVSPSGVYECWIDDCVFKPVGMPNMIGP